MTTQLTKRGFLELAHHEGMVLEWYRDSKKVGTWGLGVTNESGHNVDRYRDNPSTLERAVEVSWWLMEAKYLPEVVRAFGARVLTEAQAAAALSFHWNTGAIGKASWVKSWLAGNVTLARLQFMQWQIPAEVLTRRRAERDLFFDGVWAGKDTITVFPVRKPSYQPNFAKGRKVDIRSLL